MILLQRAEPGTSRRSQLRAIAVREARLREIWLSIFQGWSRIANVKELRDAATFGGVNLEAIVGQLELELRRREEQLVRALTLGPIVRAELEEFLTPLGPVTIQTLAERQIGARVVELTSQARVNLREQLTLLMREGPTDDILAGIATSTGLTRRQTRAVNNFRRRLIEQGASVTSAGRQAEAYAARALRRRARLIARTEAVDFTAQIVEERGRQVGNMTKQWVSARDGNVDDLCLSLDNGQTVPVNGTFQGIGGSIRRPTAHPG